MTIIITAFFAFSCVTDNQGKDSETDDVIETSSSCLESDPQYTAGQTEAGDSGHFNFELVSIDPTPPEKGENTFTLYLSDVNGNPAEEAVVIITPFMGAHGHGTSPSKFTATAAGDGNYTSPAIDLFMAGVWDITFEANLAPDETDTGSTETISDSATFAFCLEG
jgi:hypothetical protein